MLTKTSNNSRNDTATIDTPRSSNSALLGETQTATGSAPIFSSSEGTRWSLKAVAATYIGEGETGALPGAAISGIAAGGALVIIGALIWHVLRRRRRRRREWEKPLPPIPKRGMAVFGAAKASVSRMRRWKFTSLYQPNLKPDENGTPRSEIAELSATPVPPIRTAGTDEENTIYELEGDMMWRLRSSKHSTEGGDMAPFPWIRLMEPAYLRTEYAGQEEPLLNRPNIPPARRSEDRMRRLMLTDPITRPPIPTGISRWKSV